MRVFGPSDRFFSGPSERFPPACGGEEGGVRGADVSGTVFVLLSGGEEKKKPVTLNVSHKSASQPL